MSNQMLNPDATTTISLLPHASRDLVPFAHLTGCAVGSTSWVGLPNLIEHGLSSGANNHRLRAETEEGRPWERVSSSDCRPSRSGPWHAASASGSSEELPLALRMLEKEVLNRWSESLGERPKAFAALMYRGQSGLHGACPSG